MHGRTAPPTLHRLGPSWAPLIRGGACRGILIPFLLPTKFLTNDHSICVCQASCPNHPPTLAPFCAQGPSPTTLCTFSTPLPTRLDAALRPPPPFCCPHAWRLCHHVLALWPTARAWPKHPALLPPRPPRRCPRNPQPQCTFLLVAPAVLTCLTAAALGQCQLTGDNNGLFSYIHYPLFPLL